MLALQSVAQSTHGQHSAAHDTPGHMVPDLQVHAQSKHWQASVMTTVGTLSMPNLRSVLLASHNRPMGSIQLLMTPFTPLLPPRFLPSHCTGRPVYCPLWEYTALSNLTLWPLRSQCRYVGNLRLSTWLKRIITSWSSSKQLQTSLSSPTISTFATSGALRQR